ncbi:MAG: RluA family pseudouridine synthase [Pyrinomonadaceae bacterium]|nr:RluA family pseudouridine synthase [Pyrinomonadaceae bacterium]
MTFNDETFDGEATGVEEDTVASNFAFQVSELDAGVRLDAFLASRIAGASRARIKRFIQAGDVLVGNLIAKPAHKLRAGEIVEVEYAEAPPPLTDITPENIPIEIVYEDDDLAVVNKPANLVVHPGAGVASGTLANALAFHFQNLSPRSGLHRPGIVHRLDRNTSGLMVVAKTSAAHEKLAEEFAARRVFKSYVALVHGRVKEEAGRIDQPIGRDARHRTRMAVRREGNGGRHALSLYRVRARYNRFSLLDVEIKTGRTHQIRVHLAWLKHPVVGDEVYGAGRDGNLPDANLRRAVAALNRQFLHAEHLGFSHPRTNEQLAFTAPLPAELINFLQLLD